MAIRLSKKPGTNLSRKFTASVCLLVVLAMSVFWLINSFYMQKVMRQQADELGQTLSRQIASQVTELMLVNDLISLNVVLNNIALNSNITEVSVLNVDGNLLATASNNSTPPGTLVPLPFSLTEVRGDYQAPVVVAGSTAGYVRLSLDLNYMEASLMNTLLFVLAATLLLLIVAISLTRSYFQYLVRFPLQTLNFSLGRIRRGEIESCPEPEQNNEVSAVIRQFNATAEFLAHNSLLGVMFGGKPLSGKTGSGAASGALSGKTESGASSGEADADETGSGLPGQEAVTLMCVSLANYQYLASTLPEDEMAQLLNRYYFLAGRVVQIYGGRVIHCAEGALLIAFGMRVVEEEQAFHGVCAGQLFLQMIDSINNPKQRDSHNPQGSHGQHDSHDSHKPAAKYRLSIHSGQAVSELYSPVTGGDDNLTGKTVDITRQICDACPDNSLLISKDTFERAGGETRVAAEVFGDEDKRANLSDKDATNYASRVSEEDRAMPMTYLVREPIADYKLLLVRQAAQLGRIYGEQPDTPEGSGT
ncbi:MAG: AhpA/YtjB family protein [Pseudohongiellaceae bacterium]